MTLLIIFIALYLIIVGVFVFFGNIIGIPTFRDYLEMFFWLPLCIYKVTKNEFRKVYRNSLRQQNKS